MNLEQVTTTLDALANGTDPATGARIPIDAFHSPDVVRALFTAANLLRANPAAGPAKRAAAAAGLRWTDEEGAITSRLVKLGRIAPETVTTRDRSARLPS
jgi:hypothetical protein